MSVVRGRVMHGRVEIDTPLPEGAEVVVLTGDEAPFDLDDGLVTEMEQRVQAADRGEVEPVHAVLGRLRAAR